MTSKPSKRDKDEFSHQIMGMLLHWQYINNVDDDMMSNYLGVNERTYRNYLKHPENIKFNQLDSFLERNNMSFCDLNDSCSIFS